VNFGGLVFGGNVTMNGGAGSDTIIGSNSPNTISADALFAGNNVLFGGIANDSISGGLGNDIIHGGPGDDTLYAGPGGDNVLLGGAGNDVLNDSIGNDTLHGGPGNDTLYGTNGNDVLLGNAGDDYIASYGGNDTVIGGGGNDTLFSYDNNGNEFLAGDDEAYLLPAGITPPVAGNDSILGGTGNDTISSLAGLDTLFPGLGVHDYWAVNNYDADLEPFPNFGNDGHLQNDYFTDTATQSLEIMLTVNHVANGVTTPMVIPMGAGATALPNDYSPAEAIDNNGTIRFQWDAPRVFTLADFFNHAGIDFSSSGVGQFQTGGFGHIFTMTVNGVPNTQFGAYQVQNGDNIVLTWTQ
jgi:Ca2+-binding RTX toxin-like protein